MTFEELGLCDELLDAISYMGFENATPIQEKAIPEILAGKDLIACAQTGTGKTAAFVLPILQLASQVKGDFVKTLIISPTRELATQIDRQIQGLGYFVSVTSASVYGGGNDMDWERQKKALIKGTDIIVATPGKLLSHLNLGYVKFDQIKYLILDEADRMLDMGFRDDLNRIISFLPKKRQTLMFSATMPPKIRDLANKALIDHIEINIAISKPAEGVLQAAYLVRNDQKVALIRHLINDKPNYKSILIFSSTRKKVGEIVRALRNREYEVGAVSSDLGQDEREEALRKFKAKKVRILVATDVLSRGIDIKDIDLVINYDIPNSAEDYVHRVGRTARAATTGVALTLVNEEDMYGFAGIEKTIGVEVMKAPLPPKVGVGPVWNPQPVRRGRGNFKPRGRGKGNSHKKKRY